MYKIVLLFLLLFSAPFSFGSTVIKCSDIDYAGRKLDFFTYADPVTKAGKLLFSLNFDSGGNSTATVDIKNTVFVFCDFDIYHGMLFIEPDGNIGIKLPPLHKKSFADSKNPYFSPVAFWFVTETGNQLNDRIAGFTKEFNILTDKYFNRLYFRQSKAIFDSLQYYTAKNSADYKSDIFLFHKKMKLEMVRAEAFRLKPGQFSKEFATVKTSYWLYPSFIDLFDKAFGGQLSFEVKAGKSGELQKAVSAGDVAYIKKFVKEKYGLTGEIANLVVLKLLYDAYYSNIFAKEPILKMVKSATFSKSSNSLIRETSKNIIHRFRFLTTGTSAPVICLNNIEGKKICTNAKHEKYKYIIFADAEMSVCREHLKYLTTIDNYFSKYLDIFIVFRDTDKDRIKTFVDENGIKGVKLIDRDNRYIAKYRVRSFPQCYLLNSNHKVQFASAKAPLNGFEQQFGEFIKREFFMRQGKK